MSFVVPDACTLPTAVRPALSAAAGPPFDGARTLPTAVAV